MTFTNGYDFNAAIEAVTQIFSGPRADWPDALVCENDILAIGAMDALRYRFGLSVPQDVAVTGFDDIPLAASPAYDLTTYRQPITAMCMKLLDVLESKLSDSVFVEGKFISRSSS